MKLVKNCAAVKFEESGINVITEKSVYFSTTSTSNYSPLSTVESF